MNIKILVAYHKPSVVIRNDVFMPIHVGKAKAEKDLGFLGDDSGDNISLKNGIYCEMSAVYWAWKNLNADYIGLCHYRRLFTFEKKPVLSRVKSNLLYWKMRFWDNVLSPGKGFYYQKKDFLYIKSETEYQKKAYKFSSELVNLLKTKKYDYVAPYCYKMPSCSVEQFFSTLGRDHLALLKKIVSEKYPMYNENLCGTLASHELYAANMFVMRRDLFERYSEFVFGVLAEHEKRVVELGWCKDVLSEKCYSRISGYLAEFLTSSFISMIKRDESLNGIDANTMFLG